MDRQCSRGIWSVCLDTISKELVRFVWDTLKVKEIQQLIFIKNVLAKFKIEALYLITLFYYLYFTTMGARKNNSDHVMAAHIQFVSLFYLFQHLEYQLFTFAICGKEFRCLKSCKIIYALVRALVSLEKKMLLKEEIFIRRSSTNALMHSLSNYVHRRHLEENLYRFLCWYYCYSSWDTKKYLILQMKFDAP